MDAIFDYSVEDEVVGGLRSLGLDPTTIKYVLVSHAHYDHVGGAAFLQDRFNASVVMSGDDWDLLAKSSGTWRKPKRDVVATDGQRLTLGDTTLTLHFTPGHTLGTISLIRSATARAGTWRPTGQHRVQLGGQSGRLHHAGTAGQPGSTATSRRLRNSGARRLCRRRCPALNHAFDGSKEKLPAMAKRRAATRMRK
jgi:L-ascorbate metabolism protein UlaG (beta-lactamase superfamily)